PPRAARPHGSPFADRVGRDLVSPSLQDPQSLGGHALRPDYPLADVVPGRPRRRAVDLPAGDPPGPGGRPSRAGVGRAGGPRRGAAAPGRGVGRFGRRSWGAWVGGELAGGDRRRGDGHGGPSSRGPGRPTPLLAGAGGPIRGGPQAGAGGGP